MLIIMVGVKGMLNVYARAVMVSVCMCWAFYGQKHSLANPVFWMSIYGLKVKPTTSFPLLTRGNKVGRN